MEKQADSSNRILFCTDFSENALQAFEAAISAAALRPGSELVLLHVLPEPDAQFWKSYIYEVEEDVDSQAKKTLDDAIDRDYRPRIPAGVQFKTVFRIGKADQCILDVAKELSAGMIVIGRIGVGAWKALFFGSVALKVVQHAECPVLVIPPRVGEADGKA